jgi:hypothetical protein
MNRLPESSTGRADQLELSQLDLRYEGYRLRQPRLEEGLLSAIAREGIREPLHGVRDGVRAILLDGFKRHRCARQLHLHIVPFASWGKDEADGIVRLLRGSRPQPLHLLEEARFVDELHTVRGLSVADIAEQLSRSKAWVSLRLGLIAQLTPVMREALFAGDLPVYSYLYTLRPLRRLPGFGPDDLDQFVQALRGKKLSVREIEGLAHGFFRGPESFRTEILRGNLSLPLRHIQEAPRDPDACTSEFERILLQDLELTAKAMFRVIGKSRDPRLQSRPFLAQCHLLTAALLARTAVFTQTLRHLHDRCGQA